MKRLLYFVLIPAIMPTLFFRIAFTPVEILGCRTRGLLAFLIALCSGLAALCTVLMSLKGRIKGDEDSFWWVMSTLILVIPVIAMIILA